MIINNTYETSVKSREIAKKSGQIDNLRQEYNLRLSSLIRHALRVKGCSDPASHSYDVVQQAWVSIYSHLDQVQGNFLSWASAVSYHAANRHLRACIKEQQYHEPIEEARESLERAVSVDHSRVLENAILVDEALSIAQKISPAFSQILFLRLVEDVDFEDISLQLGLSLSNVRNIYYRGLSRLKKHFKEAEDMKHPSS